MGEGISSEVRVASLEKHVEAKERVTLMGSESPMGRTLTYSKSVVIVVRVKLPLGSPM